MMIELLAAGLVVVGSLFCFLAALGVLRFKDTLSRLHAATKAGAFGGSCLLLAAPLVFRDLFVLVEALLVIAFFYLTTPIASYLLARATGRTSSRPPSDRSSS
jgi:multicomponent Na+:H+ antiporter subunit G